MKYTLMPGTTYKFELFAVVGGKEYKDMMRSFTTTGNSDRQNPVITDVSVYDKTETGYKVKCKASDNVGVVKVQFPTWAKANGQDDIQKEWWNNTAASGKKDSDGYYVYEVKISEHNNELGVYYTHIYAYDKAGNSVCYVVPEVAVEKALCLQISLKQNLRTHLMLIKSRWLHQNLFQRIIMTIMCLI